MKNTQAIDRSQVLESGLLSTGVSEIADELRKLLADTFTLYLKTKAFHWHMSGRHFRDYHLLLDEQAGELFAITDDVAERSRKLGVTTLHSIGDVARHQRLPDNDLDTLLPEKMLQQLCSDNRRLTSFMRTTHEICDRHHDVATASLIEVWIDQAERRAWFLAAIMSDFGTEIGSQ
jgi:starvation-inducible DNA-binding protein